MSNWDTTEAYSLLCSQEGTYSDACYYARYYPEEFTRWVRQMFSDGTQLDPDRVDYAELLEDFRNEE